MVYCDQDVVESVLGNIKFARTSVTQLEEQHTYKSEDADNGGFANTGSLFIPLLQHGPELGANQSVVGPGPALAEGQHSQSHYYSIGMLAGLRTKGWASGRGLDCHMGTGAEDSDKRMSQCLDCCTRLL